MGPRKNRYPWVRDFEVKIHQANVDVPFVSLRPIHGIRDVNVLDTEVQLCVSIYRYTFIHVYILSLWKKCTINFHLDYTPPQLINFVN